MAVLEKIIRTLPQSCEIRDERQAVAGDMVFVVMNQKGSAIFAFLYHQDTCAILASGTRLRWRDQKRDVDVAEVRLDLHVGRVGTIVQSKPPPSAVCL